MITEMNEHVGEYSNDGVGRTFMLSTKHWCFSKLSNNQLNDIYACCGNVVLMLVTSNSLFHIKLTIIFCAL